MQKSQLIKEISTRTSLTQKNVHLMMQAMIAVIAEETQKGEVVKIKHLGTFSASVKAERTIYNPRTQELNPYPARSVPNFKASSSFKKYLNMQRNQNTLTSDIQGIFGAQISEYFTDKN